MALAPRALLIFMGFRLASPAWTYSDWITYDNGSLTRLSRLRLHIQEVSDFISTGDYTVQGRSLDKSQVERYLEKLMAKEKEESKVTNAVNGKSAPFVTARRSDNG